MAYYNKTRGLIYIHIYKAGGSSVRKILPAVGPGEGTDDGQEIVGKHARLEQVETWFIEQGRWDEYLDCAVIITVRNPYDWFVSLWNFIMHRPGHFMNAIIKDKSFAAYVNFYKAYMMEGGQYEHHLQTQFIRSVGEFNGPFIMVKLEEILLPLIGAVVMPHENKVDHDPYAEYYKDIDMGKLDFLKAECEALDYNVNLFS